MMIKIDHLSKKFDNKYVLKEISCAFTNGRVMALWVRMVQVRVRCLDV